LEPVLRRSRIRLPSLPPIAAAIAALLLASVAPGADESLDFGTRFSVGSGFLRGERPPFTLLDPAWLLPPIETLDLALPPGDGAARAEQLLHDDIGSAGAPAAPSPSDGKVGYSLSDDLTAEVGYHHLRLSDRATSQTLREDQWSAFSTRPDRDVLDLNMSWRMQGNTVGLGYQFQSDRLNASPGEGAFSRFLPGSPQATHALTLGLTREWGAETAPPVLVEVPLLPPELAEAPSEATPTPH
jgi:hypothetical protein